MLDFRYSFLNLTMKYPGYWYTKEEILLVINEKIVQNGKKILKLKRT